MIKKNLALVGSLIFFFGISLGLYLLGGTVIAVSKDDSGSFVSGEPYLHPLDVARVSERTMKENESQALTVDLVNRSGQEYEVMVKLSAPNFDISPSEQSQTITLPSQGNASVIWILTPKRAGVFEISISAGYDNQVIGINVTNLLGLSPVQAQLLSYMGSFFGPMLTAPWWYQKWKERKAKGKKISKSKQKK